jgi:molecular chaperone DnaK
MTYTLAVKTQTGMVGYERNQLVPVLMKGTSLPAEGQQRFRSGKSLVGGEDGFIVFEFYEMADGVDSPEHNLHIGNFRLDSREELEAGERISRGDDLIIDWKMSDNGTLSFSVELPKIGRLIDVKNLYLADDGHINFAGQQGEEVAHALLSRAESDLTELDATTEGGADPDGHLRERIERQHAALSASVDADTHRSVAEESRRLRQEIALLRISPENEERVLEREVSDAEVQFDELRDDAQPIDSERHDKLLVTARRSIRESNFETARRTLDEMHSIRYKVLFETPDFIIGIFKKLADEKHLSVDSALHDQYIAEGLAAAAISTSPWLKDEASSVHVCTQLSCMHERPS